MKLIVGHIDNKLTDLIKLDFPSAVLITENNSELLVEVGYTGIEEFSEDEKFLDLLMSAEEIFYYPTGNIDNFDLHNPTASSQGLTELFLFLAQQEGIKVNNYSQFGEEQAFEKFNRYLAVTDSRKTEKDSQLWCAGCSFTLGVGVDLPQRYANILSTKLNLPLSVLAKVGASISWAADQILRSDIKKNDIVIWGLTVKNRMSHVINNEILNVHIHESARSPTEKLLQKVVLDDDLLLYHQLTSISQVINFCNKIGAKLLLVGLLSSDYDLIYLKNFKNYYHYHYRNNSYLDFGSDLAHPGLAQHQEYAHRIINELDKRGYI